MVEYSKVNIKLSDSQLNKLKTAVKDQTEVALRMNVKFLMEIIYVMTYYEQEDKKLS